MHNCLHLFEVKQIPNLLPNRKLPKSKLRLKLCHRRRHPKTVSMLQTTLESQRKKWKVQKQRRSQTQNRTLPLPVPNRLYLVPEHLIHHKKYQYPPKSLHHPRLNLKVHQNHPWRKEKNVRVRSLGFNSITLIIPANSKRGTEVSGQSAHT